MKGGPRSTQEAMTRRISTCFVAPQAKRDFGATNAPSGKRDSAQAEAEEHVRRHLVPIEVIEGTKQEKLRSQWFARTT